jgi:NAD dependent epimerase/dehydratase family enzyme
VALRLGHIFDSKEGLFPHLYLASKLGAVSLGSGHQYVPWVHVTDAARAIVFAMNHTNVSGPINIVSPGVVTNRALMQQLAQTFQRPYACIPVPASVCRLVTGESAAVVLDSQRVLPKRLVESGFLFESPSLQSALLKLEY